MATLLLRQAHKRVKPTWNGAGQECKTAVETVEWKVCVLSWRYASLVGQPENAIKRLETNHTTHEFAAVPEGSEPLEDRQPLTCSY